MVPTHISTSPAQLLTQLERQVARRVERALKADGVNLEQWRVLSLLADGTGHRMSEIAKYAAVPTSTLTKIVDRLVEYNLVYRSIDGVDRRGVLVFLAARGRNLHRKLIVRVQHEEQLILDEVGETDTARLHEFLLRLLDQISDDDPVAQPSKSA